MVKTSLDKNCTFSSTRKLLLYEKKIFNSYRINKWSTRRKAEACILGKTVTDFLALCMLIYVVPIR